MWIIALLALLGAANGARDQPAFAGEPSADVGIYSALGPASAEAAADILFTNSATGAVLADDTLKLTGVTGVTLYSTSGHAAGVYRTAAFANGTFGAAFVSSDGTWLSDPMAVLRATSGGKPVSALLRLSNPHYDAANNILTLGSQILPTDSATELPVTGGVTARLVDDSKNGVAEGLMTTAPAAPLVDVGLFIDANSHALNKAGIAEQIQVCFPSCGGGYGYGGGGWGYGGGGWRDGWRDRDRGGWRG